MANKDTDTEIKSIRVFFAIFPNKFVQAQLAHQAERLEPTCGGRKVKMQHIHLTLLFLGNVAAHRIEVLRQVMKNVSVKEFEFNLEEIGYWKRNQVLYIHARQFPAELFSLVDSLSSVLSEAGFLFDKRAYKPHVTLIRKATHHVKINLDNPIKWHIKEWSLIQSKQTDRGIDYISLGHWDLKQADICQKPLS